MMVTPDIRIWILVGVAFLVGVAQAQGSSPQEERAWRASRLAWPLFASGGEAGATFVGAAVPQGLVKLGPDSAAPHSTSGYSPLRGIKGFSHLHLSGVGAASKYGVLLVAPQVGALAFPPVRRSRRRSPPRPVITASASGPGGFVRNSP